MNNEISEKEKRKNIDDRTIRNIIYSEEEFLRMNEKIVIIDGQEYEKVLEFWNVITAIFLFPITVICLLGSWADYLEFGKKSTYGNRFSIIEELKTYRRIREIK